VRAECGKMEETTCCGKYPWHLLVRTLALLLAFLTYGINANLFGPTLLDLKVTFPLTDFY
jgi:hypothetical protein